METVPGNGAQGEPATERSTPHRTPGRLLVAFDAETLPIGPENGPAPRAVCLALAWDGGERLVASGDHLRSAVEAILLDDEVELVGHSSAFDLNVICTTFPDLAPAILRKLDEGLVRCTIVREKLLAISTSGDPKYLAAPDGSMVARLYSLNDLGKKYLGTDRTDEKESEDSWRTNFALLDGKRTDEYPPEAREYALQDARDTLAIYLAQQREMAESGPRSAANEWLHVAADFCLMRMTCRGIEIDEERRSQIEAELRAFLTPERMRPLYEAGILRPPEAPRAHKRGEGMTQGKPESVDTKALHARIEEVCQRLGIEVRKTETGRTSAADEVLQDLRRHDPVLEVFAERQALQKLVTTELPRIQAKRVYARYDVLKETLRTSSSADKLYPSLNIQNVDPRVRPCFTGPFLSVDYSGIELCALAQKVYSQFGRSTLRDQINAGIDPHAFLGAQIAQALSPEFREVLAQAGGAEPYPVFLALKKDSREEARAFFAHWRKLAKPTGLGYPGGLGAETFVAYAKATYGIEVDLETARVLKELWHRTYPEMAHYFSWITESCRDPINEKIMVDGRWQDGHAYFSPLGTYRACATFCAAANGAALQTPAAEGAKIAMFNLERAYSEGACLAEPVAFIHDEFLFRVPDPCPQTTIAQVQRIMVEGMRRVLPDVRISCEAKLMRRWYKEAQEVRDERGNLVPWEPKELVHAS